MKSPPDASPMDFSFSLSHLASAQQPTSFSTFSGSAPLDPPAVPPPWDDGLSSAPGAPHLVQSTMSSQMMLPLTLPNSPTANTLENASTTDLPSAKRAKKAPTRRAKEWLPHKERIIELYVCQNKSLKEVRLMIEHETGFLATERQYRTRITQWKSDKNVKPFEMRAIVRMRRHRVSLEQHKRPLKFKVRGNPVPYKQIRRWSNNHRDSPMASPAASTPSAVHYWTASDHGSPASISTSNQTVRSSSMDPAYSIDRAGSPQAITAHLLQSAHTAPKILPGSREGNLSNLYDIPDQVEANTTSPDTDTSGPANQVSSERDVRTSLPLEQTTNYIEASSSNLQAPLSLFQLQETRSNVISEQSDSVQALDRSDIEAVFQEVKLCLDRGQTDKAEQLSIHAMEDSQRVYGHEHPDTLTAMFHLARVYLYQERWDIAEQTAKEVLNARKRILGDGHRDTFEATEILSDVYYFTNRLEAAEGIETQRVDYARRLFGDEHEETIYVMRFLTVVYALRSKFEEAQQLATQALGISKRALGDKHYCTLLIMGDLAMIHYYQHQYRKAGELLAYVVTISEKVFGEEDPDTLRDMKNLINTRFKARRIQ